MSDHLSLEIAAAAFTRGRPLEPGEPVPGCACETCTGMSPEHPARVPAWRQRNPERVARVDDQRQGEWERRVDAARHVSVLDVAQILGCGEPVRRGNELVVCCPLHEDTDPSCRIDVEADLWYCDPCAEGGDGIALYMRVRRLEFVDAVRELVA